MKWNSSFHRLTHWFEKLEFYHLKPAEEEFLEACDRIYSLTCYSAHYGAIHDIYERVEIGLGLISKLLDKLEGK